MGASWTRQEAAAILSDVASFFRDEYLYGPAGAAQAAADACRAGADRVELRGLLRSTVWLYRCCRPESVFTFDSHLGNQRAGFAVVARVIFGVLRKDRQ